jgi:hypothetical protein
MAEPGQPAAWMNLDHSRESYFPDDPSRIRQHPQWLAGHATSERPTRLRLRHLIHPLCLRHLIHPLCLRHLIHPLRRVHHPHQLPRRVHGEVGGDGGQHVVRFGGVAAPNIHRRHRGQHVVGVVK